ncbi:MAG TPA: signal peptidase I [Solirubrobacteraceae bacterium]|nr:signal peptidase I [Solirubrobacteraceae bacterium]
MRAHRTRKLLSLALGLTALGCVWFFFLPASIGGLTTYVVTRGSSMEPRFHSGDLALVRSQSSYHVGEIVAYHSKMFHTIVLHRIVGREGARYLFKGDNNNFVDFEHPLASQLVGALWLHIPGAGAKLQSIRSPALVGILVALGTLCLGGFAFTRRRRRRRREARAGAGAGRAPGASHLHVPRRTVPGAELLRGVLACGLLALLPFVALAVLAFTRPATAPHHFKIPYKQSGSFSYSAAAAPGPTYPAGVAVTGEPLFTKVLSAVQLRFAYQFASKARSSLAGTAQLAATVTSTSGWQTTFPLAAPTRFRGRHALVTGTLDLGSLLALMHSVQTTTRVSGVYTLAIAPQVRAAGSVERVPMHTKFSPELKFTLSELEARPLLSGSGSLIAAQSPSKQFTPSASGSVRGVRRTPQVLALGIARPSVATARTIALAAIVILLGAMLAMLAFMRPLLALLGPARHGESAAIRARYGRLIVPVARVSQLPGVPVIDVVDMDALARIADHYDRSILHERRPGCDAFWVTDESGQFRYALGADAASAREREPRPQQPYASAADAGAAVPAAAQAPAAGAQAPTASFAPDAQDRPAASLAPEPQAQPTASFAPDAPTLVVEPRPVAGGTPAAGLASRAAGFAASAAAAQPAPPQPAAADPAPAVEAEPDAAPRERPWVAFGEAAAERAAEYMADELHADELDLGALSSPPARIAS